MRYLTISSDYMSSGIKDDYTGEIKEGELTVDKQLWLKLSDWVKKYAPIIMMESHERKMNIELIQELDREGKLLTKEFSNSLGSEYKIRYFSEGFLKYID